MTSLNENSYKFRFSRYRDYFRWNVTSNGQSESTTRTTIHEAYRFWRWAHLDRSYDEITPAVAEEYLAYRMTVPARNKTRTPHPETIRSIRNRLKVFADYLIKVGYFKTNPWVDVKGPRSAQRYIQPPSTAQIKEIIKLSGEMGRSPRMKARNRAAVSFLVHTGVRCSEMVNLKRADVTRSDGRIRDDVKVFGKGSKERLVGLNQEVKTALKNYFALREDSNDAMLLDVEGYPITNICVRAMMQRIKTHLNQTRPDLAMRTLGTHDLRRWHFNKMARIGIPYNQMKEVGGWSTDTAMKHYIHYGTLEVAAKNHAQLDLTKAFDAI